MYSQNFKTYLLSTENPNIGIGGKNTHLLLLERGFQHIGLQYLTIYPSEVLFSNDSPIKQFKRMIKYKDRAALLSPIFRHIYALYDSITPEIQKISTPPTVIFHCHDVLTLSMVNRYFPMQQCVKILTVHGYYTQEIIDDSLLEKSIAIKKYYNSCMNIEKDAVNASDHIIAVDSRIKEYLINKFSYKSSNISIFQNATDTDTFCPVTYDLKKKLRYKYAHKNDDIIIFVPRRLVPKNGVEYAIKAIRMIKQPYVKLVIAGDGLLRKELEGISNGDDRIIFLGEVPHNQIVDYYQLSDIILVPSITSNDIQEATSLSMLEGMACGKTVICSDIGGMQEVLKNSKAGFLVPEKNPESIANIIQDIILNPESKKYGNIARSYVMEHHSYISYAKRLTDLYHSTMKTKGLL